MQRPRPLVGLLDGSHSAAGLRRRVAATLALAGHSEAVTALRSALQSLAALDAPILIVGEHGVGKHACAEALHRNGPYGAQPFHVLGPDAEELGDPVGAFERLARQRATPDAGRPTVYLEDVERIPMARATPDAGRPTVYLEDVERIPMALQAALASALAAEERLRIVVGATPHLVELVQLGRFDRDLNLLLSRVAVHVPPLRDRLSDIGAIAAAHDEGRALAAPTVAALAEYAWPGNILELIEALARARMLSPGAHLTAGAVRRVLGNRPRRWRGFDVLPLRELEHRYLLTVLARFGGNRSRAAHHLGISRNTLARKLQGCIEPTATERHATAAHLLRAAP